MAQATALNPFGYRGGITDPADMFNRDYDCKMLRLYLTRGDSCQVVGPFGIGKSSLLYVLQARAPQWDRAFTVAYLDGDDPTCQTVRGFVEHAWAAWQEGPAPSSLTDLTERLEGWRAGGRRPVLCLDNFEAFTGRPDEFTTDFFLDLRGMANQGLVFITASQQPLSSLFPSYSPVSPFFNIFRILRLGPFTPEDAADFVTLQRPGVEPFTRVEREAILAFAHGHPLALQVACAYALAARARGESLETALGRAKADVRTHIPTGW